MSEILSREEFEADRNRSHQSYCDRDAVEDLFATIEALAEALKYGGRLHSDEKFAATLREKGWLDG